VVLMDLTMPRLDGVAALRTILDENPAVHVLVVSGHGDREHVRAALEAGARGYVLKGTPTEEVADALRAVLRGETVLSPPELSDLAPCPGERTRAGRGGAFPLTSPAPPRTPAAGPWPPRRCRSERAGRGHGGPF